ncbi:MAG: sulfotransferase [Pseudomonadota bacterium]
MPEKTFTLEDAHRAAEAGDMDKAEKLYDAFSQQFPEKAAGWFGLGVVAFFRQDLEKALGLYEKALKLDPSRPHFHHNNAVALAQVGQFERAHHHFEEALRLKPDYADAWFNYSSNRKFDDPAPLDTIEGLLGRTKSDRERCLLHFAAGKISEDVRQYDRAFGHYEKGNRARGARFDRAKFDGEQRRVAAVLTEDFLKSKRHAGFVSDRPVFVIGMPRSGTTLMEDVLSRHRDVYGAGERGDIEAIAGTLVRHGDKVTPYPECLPILPDAALSGFGEAYVNKLSEVAGPALRIIDKHPVNYRRLGLIQLMLPGARIIHCTRDPVDTCLSCYFQNFRSGQDYSFDLGDLAHVYNAYRETMTLWKERLELPILDVAYEDMVGDHETIVRKVIDFLDLDWDPACLSTPTDHRTVRTASTFQVRQPVNKRSVGKSEKYRAHIGPLLRTLGLLE